jgi:hypothetical protein
LHSGQRVAWPVSPLTDLLADSIGVCSSGGGVGLQVCRCGVPGVQGWDTKECRGRQQVCRGGVLGVQGWGSRCAGVDSRCAGVGYQVCRDGAAGVQGWGSRDGAHTVPSPLPHQPISQSINLTKNVKDG